MLATHLAPEGESLAQEMQLESGDLGDQLEVGPVPQPSSELMEISPAALLHLDNALPRDNEVHGTELCLGRHFQLIRRIHRAAHPALSRSDNEKQSAVSSLQKLNHKSDILACYTQTRNNFIILLQQEHLSLSAFPLSRRGGCRGRELNKGGV